VLTANFIRDQRCRRKHPDAALPERLHQRTIVELADDPRRDALLFEPLQQRSAHRRVGAGDQHRRAV